MDRLTHEEARGGWGWDVGINGEQSEDPLDGTPAESIDDAGRSASSPIPTSTASRSLGCNCASSVEGRSVPAYAERRYAGDVGFVVVDGRSPRAPDEVALGAKTMRHADVGIGDDVAIGDRRLRVVGQAIFPNTEDGFPLAEGALFSDDGMTVLGLDGRATSSSSVIGSDCVTAPMVKPR